MLERIVCKKGKTKIEQYREGRALIEMETNIGEHPG
jgi:hypothetical protein